MSALPAQTHPHAPLLLSAIILALLAGCATPNPPQQKPAAIGPNNSIAYATEPNALGLILRDLGPALSVNFALMHGVHNRTIGPYNFRNTPANTVLTVLTNDAALERYDAPSYYFLAPADYRQLNNLNLRAMLPTEYTLPSGAVAIGAETPLFDALALLGQAFNTTVIADNAVADARTGELSMPNINGVDALEALLKSARLDTQAFRIHAGDNYLLFHAAANPPRTDIIANRESLTTQQRALLNRRVNLRLPRPGATPAAVGAYPSATTLASVLQTLSAQLGTTITADPQLHAFPVNPCHMTNVTVETALQLLINQWLAQEFTIEGTQAPSGFHITHER